MAYPGMGCCIENEHGDVDHLNDTSERVNGDEKHSI